jgi:hypothetical protein
MARAGGGAWKGGAARCICGVRLQMSAACDEAGCELQLNQLEVLNRRGDGKDGGRCSEVHSTPLLSCRNNPVRPPLPHSHEHRNVLALQLAFSIAEASMQGFVDWGRAGSGCGEHKLTSLAAQPLQVWWTLRGTIWRHCPAFAPAVHCWTRLHTCQNDACAVDDADAIRLLIHAACKDLFGAVGRSVQKGETSPLRLEHQ